MTHVALCLKRTGGTKWRRKEKCCGKVEIRKAEFLRGRAHEELIFRSTLPGLTEATSDSFMRPYFICPAPQCRFLRMGMGSLYVFLATWQQGGIKMATTRPSCSCVCQATHNDIHIHLPNKWQVCQQLRAANMCLCWKGTLPSEECPDCLGLCSQSCGGCHWIYTYVRTYIYITDLLVVGTRNILFVNCENWMASSTSLFIQQIVLQ